MQNDDFDKKMQNIAKAGIGVMVASVLITIALFGVVIWSIIKVINFFF